MHLLEQYALSCGVKIDRPFVQCNYFPVPFDDYIIIHPSSGMSAKNYDHYSEVVGLILPYLNKAGIKIVQIGGKDDEKLDGCYSLQGVTSLSQTFYLIKNALLLTGNDSFSSHVAGFFNKKIVTLYSNIYLGCCKPYWGDKENQKLIQAPRNGLKPSFANEEKNKVVNNVPPEQVASDILNFLKISHLLGKISTLNIGDKYKEKTVEVVPNHAVTHKLPADYPINLRLDYGFNPKYFMEWSRGKKIHIILDKPIDPKFFIPLKNNILKVSAFIDDTFSPKYPELIKNIGVEVDLFSKKASNLSDLRVKFIDWFVQQYVPIKKKDLDFVGKICDNTYFKSKKDIHANGEIYNSRASMLRGKAGSEGSRIIDIPEFWEESDYLNIYNKNA